MIVKELFGTQIINASFLFANSNISVKYYSKDFPSVNQLYKGLQLPTSFGKHYICKVLHCAAFSCAPKRNVSY
jgi:hypothetical protein